MIGIADVARAAADKLYGYAERIERAEPYLRNQSITKWVKDIATDLRDDGGVFGLMSRQQGANVNPISINGWTINHGVMPVDSMQEVIAMWDDGDIVRNRAGNWPWSLKPLTPDAHVIIAWRAP